MVENVDSGVKKRLVSLLSRHPEGLDIHRISKNLNVAIRTVKPVLVEMQNGGQISSGLKKIEREQVTSFERHYFSH